jgi:YesN/AraC family two-component response regulator
MRGYGVAAAVGYADIDWFSKKFKRNPVVSTGQYRDEVVRGEGAAEKESIE